MSGVWSNCCCDNEPQNCQMRLLYAFKTRFGFPALYITDDGDLGIKLSSLRFFIKQQDYHQETTSLSHLGGPFTVVNNDYHATIEVIERKTGKITISESTTEADLSLQRASAMAIMAARFDEWKDEPAGAYHEEDGNPDVFNPPYFHQTDDVNVTWVMSGLDMVGATIERTFFRKDHNRFNPNPASFSQETVVSTMVISLSSAYSDEQLKLDIDDLLRNYDTGSGLSVCGMADNTLASITWNESALNVAIGSAPVTNPQSLIAYTTLAAPVTSIATTDAASHWFSTGQWWQHTGGSHSNGELFFEPGYSKYNCTFHADTSMPDLGAPSLAWHSQLSYRLLFNTSQLVCAQWTWVNALGFVENTCETQGDSGECASEGTPRAVIFQSPHPIAVSPTNIKFPFGNHEFSSPSTNSGGNCPCS